MNFLTRIINRNNANQTTYTVSNPNAIERAIYAQEQQRKNELRAKLELIIQQCTDAITQITQSGLPMELQFAMLSKLVESRENAIIALHNM